jgi:hypothetical protein
MVETKRDYMISHITTNNNNETLMMQTPSPRQLPSSRNIDFHQNPREELTISSSKKPRGRPLGSKNKPKQPVITGKNMGTLMETVVIEIAHGNDIVETLINYVRYRQAGIIVSRGSGIVADVTILHSVTCTPSLTFEGPFHLISISGTYVNANCDRVPLRFIIDPACSSFSIYLSSGHGKTFGGVVGGKVNAAGVVWINATLFKIHEFQRMVSINGIIQEIEEDDPMYIVGVINNVDHVAHESNNKNNYIIVHALLGFDRVDVN